MTLPRTVAQVLTDHVTLEVEGIDRMYLNVYQPRLQTDRGVAAFFRFHRGETFASSALMAPMSTAFIAAVDHFVEHEQIPLITFTKGQRKDDIAKEYHSQFHRHEGIVFVGKAKEKTPVFRTEKRRNPDTGQTYPWIVRNTAMVNHYYFYGPTRTSARSSSSSAPISPTTPSFASTDTSTSSANWPRKGSPSRPWTTAS